MSENMFALIHRCVRTMPYQKVIEMCQSSEDLVTCCKYYFIYLMYISQWVCFAEVCYVAVSL